MLARPVLDVIGDIYACALEPSGLERAAKSVAELIGAHAVAIQRQHLTAPRCRMFAISGFDPDWQTDYLDHWDHRNPWKLLPLAHLRSTPLEERVGVAHVNRYITPQTFRRSAIFNDSLSKMDLYDCIAMPLFTGDHAVWIAFFCGKSKDHFTDENFQLAWMLAPHIARAAQLASKRGKQPSINGDSFPLFSSIDRKEKDLGNGYLKSRFGFTNTEAEIAALTAQGKSSTMIADMRSVKASTVRWHLKSIYAKTGVGNRAALTSVIMKQTPR